VSTAGAGKPGDNDKLVTRNHHIDVFEIMLTRAFDENVFFFGHVSLVYIEVLRRFLDF